jgi:hypothetical protein
MRMIHKLHIQWSVLKPGHKNSPPPQGGTHLTDLKYVYKEVAAISFMKSSFKVNKEVHIHDFHSNKLNVVPCGH